MRRLPVASSPEAFPAGPSVACRDSAAASPPTLAVGGWVPGDEAGGSLSAPSADADAGGSGGTAADWASVESAVWPDRLGWPAAGFEVGSVESAGSRSEGGTELTVALQEKGKLLGITRRIPILNETQGNATQCPGRSAAGSAGRPAQTVQSPSKGRPGRIVPNDEWCSEAARPQPPIVGMVSAPAAAVCTTR